MQSLFCAAGDCVHNKQGQCSANVIQVSNSRSETFCDTYTKSDSFVAGEDAFSQYATLASQSDTEFGADETAAPNITCNVCKCAYNKSFHCKAHDVQIDDPQGSMKCNCKTYRPK